MSNAHSIFISYRRCAIGHARGLYVYLSGRFGHERVFFDQATIEGGDVFPEELRRGVEGCAVLLALIAREWLDVKNADGGRRLDDPHDLVRQEIALALEREKKVIPVLFDDTRVPPADRLPAPLKALATRDALWLGGKMYEYNNQCRELIRLLTKVPGVPEPLPEANGAVAATLVEGTLQQVKEQRETIRVLERQLDASEAQLRAFFQIIDEAQVPPEQQSARLVEIAVRYRQSRAQAQVASLPSDDPEVVRLKEAARSALDAWRWQEADDHLVQVEAAQDAVLDRRQLCLQREIERQQMERAATAAQRASIALTRLRYREASAHFATAARRVPPEHEEQTLAYLDQETYALYRQGDEFGDSPALANAIDRYRALLKRRNRERVPLDWARTQNNLGNALATLGEREKGRERLEEAVAAFREALKERAQERVPLDWASTQNNLGNALVCLGEREKRTERLEEAVAAFREALKELTRDRVPFDWAMTQTNFGNALLRRGERESGTKRLEEAVAAYRAALQVYTREGAPLRWAGTQNNLGAALRVLGKRESGTARLKEAEVAFLAALQGRRQVPFKWAETQNGLGATLRLLGERENDTERLEQAVKAYHSALQVYTRKGAPLRWAETQNNLGQPEQSN